ncbi:MAG TPA: hypothetical protein VH969_14610 [Actinophytocola sp.]|uniref:hypothetical protein n=1 Tax=Actinophytocola sp. TaxID=1872138 RepID=UPI002F95AF5A
MIDPDLRTVRNDDRLLDRIGRGERIRPRDEGDIEAMLSAWRLGLPIVGPPDSRLLDAVTGPPRRRAKRRAARASVGIAASVAMLSGGVMTAAAYANPDSPLWPVTRIVYGDMAQSRIALDNANRAVADARTAADDGRYDEAKQLLAAADDLADKVDDPDSADRLRADIAKMRSALPPDPRSKDTPAAGKPTASLGVEPPPLDPGNGPKAPKNSAPRGSHPAPGKGNDNGQDKGNDKGNDNGNGADNGSRNGNGDNGDDDQGGGLAPAPEKTQLHKKKVQKPHGHDQVTGPGAPAKATPKTTPATTPAATPEAKFSAKS